MPQLPFVTDYQADAAILREKQDQWYLHGDELESTRQLLHTKLSEYVCGQLVDSIGHPQVQYTPRDPDNTVTTPGMVVVLADVRGRKASQSS